MNYVLRILTAMAGGFFLVGGLIDPIDPLETMLGVLCIMLASLIPCD